MATFQFEAMNAQGKEEKGEIEALSSEEAISKIRNMGYFPTKIREKGGARRATKGAAAKSSKPRRPRGTGGRTKTKQLTQFTRQLSTLQDAGLPILRSLRILQQQQKPGTLKAVAGAVANDVEAGASLSEAMARYPKTFNSLYSNMVAAGEAGGVLDLILNRLADFMEKSARLKAKIIHAMIYPIAVLSIAFGIVTGIMYFVVPKDIRRLRRRSSGPDAIAVTDGQLYLKTIRLGDHFVQSGRVNRPVSHYTYQRDGSSDPG